MIYFLLILATNGASNTFGIIGMLVANLPVIHLREEKAWVCK